MEDCQRRQEAAAVGAEEEGRGLRDRASSVFAVEVVKDEDVSLLSKRGESSLRVSVRKEEKVIRWERFLPRKFLRVLLVENDDSTRHIVATLLRKCSYQVAAVADGLKAWDVLKEKHYNFDLVLTEVETPSLSGIGLLSKIMSDEICKNIPVIMMSSNDSVGIVFKCMLKGAADFLVKPVRKNELRNLWQHVWRKYCSSSCGIGSGNRNLNLARLETMSDNVAAINHGKSIADNGSKTASSPDKDSDMESSCIRPEDGIGGLLKLREGSEREYRNFTLETYSTSKKRECDESHENGKTKDETMGIEIKMSLPIQAGASTRSVFEANGFYNGSPCREEDLVSARSKEGAICDFEHLNQIERNIKQSKEIFDFIGAASTEQSKFPISEDKDQAEDKSCKNSEIPDVKRNTNSVPTQLWELSLRGPQHKFKGHEVFQEKHVLNHSHASAFSRYGGEKLHVSCSRSGSSSASLCIRTSDSNGSNCHINPTIDKAKSIHFPLLGKLTPHRSEVEAITYYQLSSGSSKENAGPSASVSLKENAACVGHFSTVKPVIPHAQLEVIPHSIPVGALPFQNFCVGYGPIPHPIFCPKPFRPLCVSSENEKAAVFNPSAQDCNDLVNIHHINSSVGSEGHQLHMWKKVMEEQKSNTKTAYNSPMLRTSYEIADQVGNCNQDIADARRCNGSNDDVSVAVNMGTITESGTEEGFRNCKGDNLDRSCSQREAALSRFRLKRKDRCFEKKVRYHSRKKLAEQRPRLKGQFVRQAGAESAMITLESD